MPEPRKRQLLRVKRIDTIGLVDRGDNPEADIVFWKRDPGATVVPANDPDAARAAEPGTDEARKRMDELEKAQADLEAARADVEALRAEVETLKAQVPAEPEDVLKGLTPEARAEVEAEMAKRDERIAELEKKAETEAAEKQAVIEKAERDTTALRFAKGGDLEGLSGDKRTDLVLACKKALAPEDFAALDVMLKAAAEQIRTGGLFKEVGKDGEPSGDGAWAKIEARAKEMVEKGEAKTMAQAIAEVGNREPALYQEYEEERKAR